MKSLAGVLALAIVISQSHAKNDKQTPVTKCPEGVLPDLVYVGNVGDEPCTESPCPINPSKAIELKMNFTAPYLMEDPYMQVYVSLIHMDYPFINHDACSMITNTVCPPVANEDIEFHFQMSLPSRLPSVSVDLQFYLQPDQKSNTKAVCFGITVMIVN
ncbi:uncharacterized protein LOC109601991 [Aethina tumida]|uniref:uncharacterized protein LOC109601991 n=1 Tax=Aethina tumida TaxID=116153 RepID=UPI00096B4B1A|nr:uncharacterized protein LOC109601991 [Aethina tumida]